MSTPKGSLSPKDFDLEAGDDNEDEINPNHLHHSFTRSLHSRSGASISIQADKNVSRFFGWRRD